MSQSRGPLPSVDEVLRSEAGVVASARFGRDAARSAIRTALDAARTRLKDATVTPPTREDMTGRVGWAAVKDLESRDAPRLKRVFNLTGTILHTNLGRAVLAEEAIAAAVSAMRHPAALEFDLDSGGRGERDDLVRELICELTGCADALVVNNNAAAVLLVLNTLGLGRSSIVSRGELIEIGGAFRMPDIMARAGTRLVEVGTTNRTHARDYESAIGGDTALLLKVHTSNYLIQGFTKEVSPRELAGIGARHAVPVVDDLGSGTLVDLTRYGLKAERTVRDAVADGADLVTFSGDKLLGGPQAGFVIGRKDLVRACAKNPMKRALRLDKIRLAALEATLKLYRDPDRLPERLPTLRAMSRPSAEIDSLGERLRHPLAEAIGAGFAVSVGDCASQIGSGALPLETIPSRGLVIAPIGGREAAGRLDTLVARLRALPIPVIGHVEKGALVLDLRCLDDEAAFRDQLTAIDAGGGA